LDSIDRRYFITRDLLDEKIYGSEFISEEALLLMDRKDYMLVFQENSLVKYPIIQWVETDTEHIYMLVIRDPLYNELSNYMFFPQYTNSLIEYETYEPIDFDDYDPNSPNYDPAILHTRFWGHIRDF
jgi:hypothetical protein